MNNTYTIIDRSTWKREPYCAIYKMAVQPQYCVSFELDVTHFRKAVKSRSLSFTFAFIFAVTAAADKIEEFRYRFLNGEVVLYDSIDTSFTIMDSKTELFKVVNVPMQDTVEEYAALAKKTSDLQQVPFTGPVDNDVYQFSALPWIKFTHVSHTDFGNPEKAQPIFDWGQFYENNGKWMMPFAVQAHHGFVDGIHIAQLATELQNILDHF